MFMVFHLWLSKSVIRRSPSAESFIDAPRIAACFEGTVNGQRVIYEESQRATGHSAGGDIIVERNAAWSQGIQVVQTSYD
jgi:hypothetical protein